MIPYLLVFGIFLSSSTVQCKVLPKYISKCSLKNSDKFSQCVMDNAKSVIPLIVNGDKNHKIPNLNPLFIEILQLNSGTSLNLTLFNQSVQGLPTVDLKSVKFNKDKQQLIFDFVFDYLRLDGNYSIDGKILVLPVVGHGKGILDFRKPHIVYSCNLSTIKNKKGEVIRVVNPNLKTDFEKVFFHMDNLFNGNKELGDQINKFLNENWKDVINEFQQLVEAPMNSVFSSIMRAFLNDLTYEAAFDGV